MDQKQFASLGGLAAAKALTAEQRIERATVASDAARIARAALRKAKAVAMKRHTHATNGAFGTQIGKFSRADRFVTVRPGELGVVSKRGKQRIVR